MAYAGKPLNELEGGTSQTTYTTGNMLYASGTNTFSKLAIDTFPNENLGSNGSIPLWLDPCKYIHLRDDFYSSEGFIFGRLAWAGTGNAGLVSGNTTLSDPTHPTCIRISTSTSASSSPSLSLNSGSGSGCVLLGGGPINMRWVSYAPTLSDGTETYTLRWGFFDIVASGTIPNGCWFEYSHGVNSGNWTINTSNNSTQTNTNTSTAFDTNWHNYMIVVNAAATSVSFYIDDVEVSGSPLSTNIPTASGREVAPAFQMVKSAGTTARFSFIDMFEYSQILTTTR